MCNYHEKIVDGIIYLLMYGDQPGARDGNTYCLCFTAVWYVMHNASDICRYIHVGSCESDMATLKSGS